MFVLLTILSGLVWFRWRMVEEVPSWTSPTNWGKYEVCEVNRCSHTHSYNHSYLPHKLSTTHTKHTHNTTLRSHNLSRKHTPPPYLPTKPLTQTHLPSFPQIHLSRNYTFHPSTNTSLTQPHLPSFHKYISHVNTPSILPQIHLSRNQLWPQDFPSPRSPLSSENKTFLLEYSKAFMLLPKSAVFLQFQAWFELKNLN